MARGRARVLRRRRRVPHGLSLPADAADVHGGGAGRPVPDDGDPGPDPGDPAHLPVGAVPAQPRRAHAGDGDRPRAGLHVPHLRGGPSDARERGHPPAPRSAHGQRPGPHQAPEQPAALAARLAHHLLRRRDRHGRQFLPRRPQRGAHPDAVEPGPQRGVLARGPAAPVSAPDHGPGVWLRGRQRRGPAARAQFAPQLDAPAHRGAQGPQGVRARHLHHAPPGQPQDLRLRATVRKRDHPLRGEPRPLRSAGGAGPRRVPGLRAGGAPRRQPFPPGRGAALLPDPAGARFLLVPADPRGAGPRLAPAAHARRGTARPGPHRRPGELLPGAGGAGAPWARPGPASAARAGGHPALPARSAVVRGAGRASGAGAHRGPGGLVRPRGRVAPLRGLGRARRTCHPALPPAPRPRLGGGGTRTGSSRSAR